MNTSFIPRLTRFRDAECHTYAGEARRVLLDDRATDGALSVSHVQFDCGVESRLHQHSQLDEWFLVERGEFSIRLDREEVTLQDGDFVFIPQGMQHSAQCLSNKGGALWVGHIKFNCEQITATRASSVTRCKASESLEPSILIASEQPHTQFGVVQYRISSLGDVTSYENANANCAFIILEGRVECHLGEARIVAEAGDILWTPHGLQHSFRVISPTSGHWLAFSSNPIALG